MSRQQKSQPASDEDLYREFLAGDRAALEEIYHRYKARLLAYIMAILGRRRDAEDVLHDLFLFFVSRPGAFRFKGLLRGFLFTSARNRALNALRRLRLEDESCSRAADLFLIPREDETEPVVDFKTRRQLAEAVAALDADLRDVVVLRAVEGMTFREIAQVVDRNRHTVRSRYQKALRELSKVMKKVVQ